MGPGSPTWPVRLYPPWFRERYGAELESLIEDLGPDVHVTADLVLGAARAWLRPALSGLGEEGRRRRLQASVATTWVAWCAGGLAEPALTRALLDPPVAGVDASVRRLLDIGLGVWFAGGALAAGTASLLAGRILLPAVRRRDGRVLRPLVPALALGALEVVGTGAVLALSPGHPAAGGNPSVLFILAGLVWLVGFVALAVAGGFGPVVVLVRARPDAVTLRWPALAGVLVAGCLTVITCAGAAAVVVAGPDVWSTVPVIAAGVASVAALTGSGRAVPVIARR